MGLSTFSAYFPFRKIAAQTLFARELLGDLFGHILAHGANAFDLADSVGGDRGYHVFCDVDAAVFLGAGQILSILSHSDILSLFVNAHIESILSSFSQNYNS